LRVALIKLAVSPQLACVHALESFGVKLLCQSIQQAFAILRTIRAVLLVLLNVKPDSPVSQRQRDVDGPAGARCHFIVDVSNSFDQTIECKVRVHSRDVWSLHGLSPRPAGDAELRRRRLRNRPEAVWIFDCSESIDSVESFGDLSDSVWLFLDGTLVDSTGRMPVGLTAKMAMLR
jgi:hypothetical protein